MSADKPWKQNFNNSGSRTRDEAAGEQQEIEETNPLAIVPSGDPPLAEPEPEPEPVPVPREPQLHEAAAAVERPVSAQTVRKEEVESKISAWENEEMSKINSRFKRQEAIINSWETDQIERAGAFLKKIERKLEEKRAKAVERMQNEVAIARQKAEEKRASVEAKRGEKVARVLEMAKLMKIVGRAPSKRSFFKSSKPDWA